MEIDLIGRRATTFRKVGMGNLVVLLSSARDANHSTAMLLDDLERISQERARRVGRHPWNDRLERGL